MRKEPTPEQKEKARERREKFRALAKQLADMPEAERAKLTIRLGAVVTVEGHALSLANTMLLLMQHPSVSVVGGFHQWIKAGRAVRKGEHGAMIWVPLKDRQNATETVEAPPTIEKTEAKKDRRFIVGTVFDISQTDAVETHNEQKGVVA